MSDPKEIIPKYLTPNATEEWDGLYWSNNLPLQMWPEEESGEISWRVLNYMPRKNVLRNLEGTVTETELPQFCENAATVLRNLADLFEALGERKIRYIYYPDETVESAIKSCEGWDDK